MPDYILFHGDKVKFESNFENQASMQTSGLQGKLIGGGKAHLNGKKICIKGDEKRVAVPGCIYKTPQYPIPGMGILLIDSLADNQIAKDTRSKGKPVLLRGKQFNAKFQVVVPAMKPTSGSPVPDSKKLYAKGKGTFKTQNKKFRAS